MSYSAIHYSTTIPYKTEKQRFWLLAKLEELDLGDDSGTCSYEDDESSSVIGVFTEDGAINPLLELVADYQKAFKLTTPWTLIWASVSRNYDAVNGGVAIVYRGEMKTSRLDDLAAAWTTHVTTHHTLPSTP